MLPKSGLKESTRRNDVLPTQGAAKVAKEEAIVYLHDVNAIEGSSLVLANVKGEPTLATRLEALIYIAEALCANGIPVTASR